MAKDRKSKIDGTYFTKIPSSEEIKDYESYKKLMTKIVRLRNALDEAVKQSKIINTKYQNYLMANPHKEERKALTKEVENLQDKLINVIPDKYNVGGGK
jgi:hypothetical protein